MPFFGRCMPSNTRKPRWMTPVLSILRKLKPSKMKANINGKSTWVATTVDYTTMDTEFIGMVYEGLLDYELRRVHEDDGAMVTLRIGQQPMLPISLLESQDDAQLKSLIKTLDKKRMLAPLIWKRIQEPQKIPAKRMNQPKTRSLKMPMTSLGSGRKFGLCER